MAVDLCRHQCAERQIAHFLAADEIAAVAVARVGQYFAVGDQLNNVYILDLTGYQSEPATVIPAFGYHFDSLHWDEEPTARCARCGSWFLPENVLGYLDRTVGLKHSRTAVQRGEVSEGQCPLYKCPHCLEPLRWAPFVLDRRSLAPTEFVGGARILGKCADEVTYCAYSPDGQQIASGSSDGSVKVWNVHASEEVLTLRRHESHATTCVWSPDGERLLSASGDGTIKMWDPRTGASIRTFERLSGAETVCAFSPDGRSIVSGVSFRTYYEEEPDPGYLKIWDVANGDEVRTLNGHSLGVRVCAYSPDGGLIASGSDDQTLRVWSADAGLEILAAPHDGAVTSCAFSPNARWIASGSEDKSIKIWDARTGLDIASLIGHSRTVNSLAVSTDGRRIISCSDDRTLKVWDLDAMAEVSTFYWSEPLLAVALRGCDGLIAAGDNRGRVITLRLVGFTPEVPIITAVHLWERDTRSWWQRMRLRRCIGSWDAEPSARCVWCGQRFLPARMVLDTIAALTANKRSGHSIELPDSAWNEPRLLSDCPQCHQSLRFNPFVVDNRDWH
jgi:WD40 repeat protein